MNKKLKSCPFCGGEAEVFESDAWYIVGCYNISCPIMPHTWMSETVEEAIECWNRRVDDGRD